MKKPQEVLALLKPMSRPDIAVGYATFVSSGLLFGAIVVFQKLLGMDPCKLCIWQRWPHAFILLFALIYWKVPKSRPAMMALIAIAAAIAMGLGIFHAGVEQGWWEFISSCTSETPLKINDMSAFLRGEEVQEKIARCDAIAWSLLGLSMAAWQALASASILGVLLWGRKK